MFTIEELASVNLFANFLFTLRAYPAIDIVDIARLPSVVATQSILDGLKKSYLNKVFERVSGNTDLLEAVIDNTLHEADIDLISQNAYITIAFSKSGLFVRYPQPHITLADIFFYPALIRELNSSIVNGGVFDDLIEKMDWCEENVENILSYSQDKEAKKNTSLNLPLLMVNRFKKGYLIGAFKVNYGEYEEEFGVVFFVKRNRINLGSSPIDPVNLVIQSQQMPMYLFDRVMLRFVVNRIVEYIDWFTSKDFYEEDFLGEFPNSLITKENGEEYRDMLPLLWGLSIDAYSSTYASYPCYDSVMWVLAENIYENLSYYKSELSKVGNILKTTDYYQLPYKEFIRKYSNIVPALLIEIVKQNKFYKELSNIIPDLSSTERGRVYRALGSKIYDEGQYQQYKTFLKPSKNLHNWKRVQSLYILDEYILKQTTDKKKFFK